MCLFMRVVLISNNSYLVIKSNLPLELLGTHTDPNWAKSKETAFKKKNKNKPDSAPRASGICLSCPFSLLHLMAWGFGWYPVEAIWSSPLPQE